MAATGPSAPTPGFVSSILRREAVNSTGGDALPVSAWAYAPGLVPEREASEGNGRSAA